MARKLLLAPVMVMTLLPMIRNVLLTVMASLA